MNSQVMNMLRANANYNDRTGSTLGSGYIGGCAECGESCMHCGSGYIGGFKGERKFFDQYCPAQRDANGRLLKMTAAQKRARKACIEKAIREHQSNEIADQYFGRNSAISVRMKNLADLAKLNPKLTRAEVGAKYRSMFSKPKKARKGCAGAPKGLQAYCEFRNNNPGLSRHELSLAWADEKLRRR